MSRRRPPERELAVAARILGFVCAVCVVGVSTGSGQSTRAALTAVRACAGDTVRLEGSPYYVTFDWKPDLFGRRDGRRFSFLADRDRDIVLRSEPPLGPNLIPNNNFSDGLAGYQTDYTVVTPSSGKPGELAVLADLRDFEPGWRDCPDVTRDGGPDRMVVLRGSGDAESAILRNRVRFERDSFYVITFLATTTGVGGAPAGGDLGVRVDGTVLAASLQLPDFNCSWRQFSSVYRAPRTGEYVIEIVDKAGRPGFGYAIDGTLTAKVEPTRVDTFRVRVVAADSVFASTVDVCPGEVFAGRHFRARRDTMVCTRIPRAGRCDSVFCESVTFRPRPAIGVDQRGPSCAGAGNGRVSLSLPSAGTGYDVAWADGPTGATRTGLAGGTYVATVTTPAGCTERREVTLAEPTRLTFRAVAFVPDDCPGAGPLSLVVDTRGGTGRVVVGFRQNDRDVGREALRGGAAATVSAVDSLGCRIDTSVRVPLASDLAALAIAVTREGDGSAVVDWTGGPDAVAEATWRLGGAAVGTGRALRLGPGSTGPLGLQLRTASGCVWTAALDLAAAATAYFPNAFSPNGDGVNDAFWIVPRPNVVAVERFEVYDRWGGLVCRREGCPAGSASAAGRDCAWQGREDARDLALDAGTYVYAATLLLADGSTVTTAGAVNLVR